MQYSAERKELLTFPFVVSGSRFVIGNRQVAIARIRYALCNIAHRSFPTYCLQNPVLGHSDYPHLADKQDLAPIMSSGDANQAAAQQC